MASADKVKILCRHGGNFIRESNQLRYEGGKNYLVLVDQDINYSNLSIKVRETCKLTDITSIRYKYPGLDLDSLVSIEEDDHVSIMMNAFSHSNMVIDLFVSEAQNSSTLVATSEPVVHAPKDLNGSNGIVVLSRHAIESNTGSVQNIQNDLHEMECNEVDDLQNLDNGPSGTVLMDFDEGRNTGMSFPDISNFNVGNGFHEVVAGHLLNSNNGPIGVASEGLNGNKETSIHNTNLDMGDVPQGSYENECNEMDNAVSSPCLKVDRGANDIKEGQEFENQTAFRKALRNHAICSKFEYKRTRSGNGVFKARCLKPSCSWSITACNSWSITATSDKDTFKIKSLKGNHTCNSFKRSRKHKHVTEKWIADFVTDQKFVHHNPNDIVRAIDREYGIEVSYHKARRGKILAEKRVAGIETVEQSIAGIETVLKWIEKTNPGSTAKLSRSSDKSLRIFVAYKASICGFLDGCRPALALNYMMIYRIGMVWMYAAAADAIDDTFPVASAFVQSNSENWKWFCEELAHILEGKIPELIFLPDPRGGFIEVVRDGFPNSQHRYPLQEVREWMSKYLDHISPSCCTVCPQYWMSKDLIHDAAVALNQNEFDAKMVALRNKSKARWKFMKGIEPKHWAMSHFEGNYRLMFFADYKRFLKDYERLSLSQDCPSTEGQHIVQHLKDFHKIAMESFNGRSEESCPRDKIEAMLNSLSDVVHSSCGKWPITVLLCPCKEATQYEVHSSCGKRSMITLTCPCKEAIRCEVGNDYYEQPVPMLPCPCKEAIRYEVQSLCGKWSMLTLTCPCEEAIRYEVRSSCGKRQMLALTCPCKEAIRYEGGNDYYEWFTAAKYGKTYLQKIYPLPDPLPDDAI